MTLIDSIGPNVPRYSFNTINYWHQYDKNRAEEAEKFKDISFYQVFRVEDIDQLFEHNDINSNLVILHSKKDINKAKEARIIDDLKRKTVWHAAKPTIIFKKVIINLLFRFKNINWNIRSASDLYSNQS